MKTRASKRTLSSRCSAEPWDEASTATLRSPASSISRNRRCRSIASGVVCGAGRTSPPTTQSTVPTSPGERPAAARTERRRKVVVVLPFVPVTPATSSARVGSPKKASAAIAIAARASSTTSCGTSSSSGRSTTSATAPAATASAAKSCPSAREPGTQKNTAPGVTRRASYARSVTSTAPRAVLSLAASTRVRSSRSTEHHSTAGCRREAVSALPPDRAARATGPRWRSSSSRARRAAPRGTGDRTARCP